MDSEQQAKDVAALFNRAGLRHTGTYREFSRRRTAVTTNGEAAPVSAFTPPPTAPASSAKVSHFAEPITPPLERLLAGNQSLSQVAAGQQKAITIAVLSLAGGVGKTTLVSTLGRILSGTGRRVVLANCGSGFGMQHLLGARAQRVGSFTFLHAPDGSSALPLTLIEAGQTADIAAGTNQQEEALRLIRQASLHADMTLLDMPVSPCAATRDLLRTADHLLVPILPDVHSAVTLPSLEAVARGEQNKGPQVHYVLNRYEPSRPLHREMRERLQTMLGIALLPIAVHEDTRIQDAMRNGVTIVDYAPGSPVVADMEGLAQWMNSLPVRATWPKGTSV